MISRFDDKYAFLSNFHICPVEFEGLKYTSSEAAFQAQKTLSEEKRAEFCALAPGESKRLGRKVDLRPDWEEVKDQIMYDICYAKFTQNPKLALKLINTGTEELIEGNTWNDTYWGVCNGVGQNKLGQTLMKLRAVLKAEMIYKFDAKKTKDQLVEWIRNWFAQNGPNCNAVIGLSGGKDSSIVAALCVEALGKDRVVGVTMPNIVQTEATVLSADLNDVDILVKHLGIRLVTLPIAPAYTHIIANLERELGGYENVTNQTRVNLAPRIRMAGLYAVSQSLNGRVANTCNWSEEYVGYSTRFGDSVGDFAPLVNLTVTELLEIGKYLDIPYHLVDKKPADGLCGKTDEDNLGFSYAVLDRYIRTGECPDKIAKELIDEKHRKNLFKLEPIPSFIPTPDVLLINKK